MFKDVEQLPSFPDIEREILRFWEMERPFEQLVEQNKKGKKWSFYDGPITANNPMGMHHAWGRTYKDIFCRHRAMLGYQQRYQNGFDCQGLWVEVEVEKELGLNSKQEIEDYGLDRFAERCKARVQHYAHVQTEQTKRLGNWMHWDDSYYTMADENITAIWHFLKTCDEKGWLYQGLRSMPWCWRCGSSLSQHELAAGGYREVAHEAVFFKVSIDGPVNEHLLVWTTTPWTLAANVAVAVHPKMEYVKVKQGDDVLILAAEAKDRALKGDHEVIETIKGEALVGLTYTGPTDVPPREDIKPRVIPWKEGVTGTEGTGIVHIAPGCGAEDFELSKIHDLPVLVPLDEAGCFTREYGEFSTKHAHAIPQQMFDHLEKGGRLYRTETYEHRYPVCWRCKEELVFRVVDEWFIAADEIRPKLIEATKGVRWIPEYAGKRMLDWLNNMGDWCISRKRFWGLPLPFYPCKKCDTVVKIGSREELAEHAVEGMDQLTELHRPWIDAVKIKCPGCGETLERVTEVGDCWLDAGIMPFSTVPGYFDDREAWDEWFPADFISEMVEQVRLWFYSTMFMSVTLEERAPYRAVMTYEYMVAEDGTEFSKTGYNIPFDEGVERMGADVMRWMYAAAPTEKKLRFGYGLGEKAKRRLLTLWNTYKFFVTYAAIDEPKKLGDALSNTNLKDIDRWILARLQELVGTCRDRLDNFDTGRMTRAIEEFIDDLSNWYVRANRRRFWRNDNDKDKHLAYRTLYRCLKTLIGLLAPVLPSLTEKIYQNLVRRAEEDSPPSVHLNRYPGVERALENGTLVTDMRAVKKACEMGHATRARTGLRNRQPLREVIICVSGASLERGIQIFSGLIQQELNVKAVKLVNDLASIQTYTVRPNFSMLGRKYGAAVPHIQAAISEVDQRETALAVMSGNQVALEVDGTSYTLLPSELEVVPGFAEHLCAAEDTTDGAPITVILNTKLTLELEREGLARDVIRHIQELRKSSGYHVTDRIEVQMSGVGEALGSAIGSHRDLIMKETLAEKLELVEHVTFRDQCVDTLEGEVTIGTLRRY